MAARSRCGRCTILPSFRRRWLALFVAAFCLQVLSNTYVAYFMIVPIAVVMAFHAVRSRDHAPPLVARPCGRRRRHRRGAGAGRRAVLPGAGRPSADPVARGNSNRAAPTCAPTSFRRAVCGADGCRCRSRSSAKPRRSCFPASSGRCWPRSRSRSRGAAGRIARWAVAYGLIAVAGFVLSLGPLVRIWGVVLTHHGPYDWLQHVLPGMGGMRVPSRFVVSPSSGCRCSIGFGALLLTERLRPRARAVAIAILLAGVVADGWAVPIPIVRVQSARAASRIARLPSGCTAGRRASSCTCR